MRGVHNYINALTNAIFCPNSSAIDIFTLIKKIACLKCLTVCRIHAVTSLTHNTYIDSPFTPKQLHSDSSSTLKRAQNACSYNPYTDHY